jgi:hypothetical protein
MYWQRVCMAYTAPTGQVVYDDDPARASARLSADPALCNVGSPSKPIAGRTIPCWDRLWTDIEYGGARGREPILFMHALRPAKGKPLRVVVFVFNRRGGMFSFGAYIPHPGSLTRLPVMNKWENGFYHTRLGDRSICFYAGQADPADQSHFTVPYEMDGRRGILDGWWHDGGFRVNFRDGPAAEKENKAEAEQE